MQSPQMCPLTLREGGETTEINACFEKHPTNAKILLCYPAGLWDIAGGIRCNYCRPHTHTHTHTHTSMMPGQMMSLDTMATLVQNESLGDCIWDMSY